MNGGIPPQSPTNLYAQVNLNPTANGAAKLKEILGLTSVKYAANRMLNGTVNKLGTTAYQSGHTIPYHVTFPAVMHCDFYSGYGLHFTFFGYNGTEGSNSQVGYTPNPWMGWGNIFDAGTSYVATPQYTIGGTGMIVNTKAYD